MTRKRKMQSVLIVIVTLITSMTMNCQIDYDHPDLSLMSLRSSFPTGDTFVLRVRPVVEDLHVLESENPSSNWKIRRYLLEARDSSPPKLFTIHPYFVSLTLSCLSCRYRDNGLSPIRVKVVAYNHVPDENDPCPRPLTEEDKLKFRWNAMSTTRYLLREMDFLRFYVIGVFDE